MRLALIEDGLVVNVVEAEPDFRPGAGLVAVPSGEAGPGWTHDGKNFSPPQERLGSPRSVSMFQFREAMRRTLIPDGGSLLQAVERHAQEKSEEDPKFGLAWEYAPDIERDGDLVETLARAFNLDDGAMDDLFRLAASFRA